MKNITLNQKKLALEHRHKKCRDGRERERRKAV
jgi:hypothetical protein